MACPPYKRLKAEIGAAPDPFDDEEFTQDDLDEIDVIASQAVISDAAATGFSGAEVQGRSLARGRTGASHAGSHSTYRNASNEAAERPFGQEADHIHARLEAQQAELKRKLREVEEELLMKNGEIRVLRDSLRQLRQEKDVEKQAQLLQERDRTLAQSEKEKTLAKKVQSLQSELHFKEAEINEMKSKLQISEKNARLVPTSTLKNSPRRCQFARQPEMGGASALASSFITKETFGAQLTNKDSPLKAQTTNHVHTDGKKADNSTSCVEEDRISTSTYHRADVALLNLLLQLPLRPSSLGLCHLLCVSPDAVPNLLVQSSIRSSTSSLAYSSSSSSSDGKLIHGLYSNFTQAQSLAVSGLGMLALNPKGQMGEEPSNPSSGAVYLLPLLEHHLSVYYRVLESGETGVMSPAHSLSSSSSGGGACVWGAGPEGPLGGLEETAIAALRTLQLLISHSGEVVDALLGPQATPLLLTRLMQLTDPALTSVARRRDTLLNSSLTVLNTLAERAGDETIGRLRCVLSNQCAARCVMLESSVHTLRLAVSLLALIVQKEELAVLLCSHTEPCQILRILQFVLSAPSKSVTQTQWCVFELEVVRLLTRLFMRNSATWTTFVESSCHCNNELVRMLVLLLHRQWLELKGREQRDGAEPMWVGPGVHLVREALMLLHWLSLNQTAFTEHCLDVLHMYEQVIPALRDCSRKIPGLTHVEEVALEEMCRSETEGAEVTDMDTDS